MRASDSEDINVFGSGGGTQLLFANATPGRINKVISFRTKRGQDAAGVYDEVADAGPLLAEDEAPTKRKRDGALGGGRRIKRRLQIDRVARASRQPAHRHRSILSHPAMLDARAEPTHSGENSLPALS